MNTPSSTILIVDDDAASRKTLEALLLALGYYLVTATNGPEALTQAAAHQPDLILLDVMMPGMDGFEVCQRLRATPKLAEVPIIMVTALDDRDARLRGIEAGADDFIPKPYDRVELRARVQAITRLNRYRRLLGERARVEWVIEHADDGYLLVSADDTISYCNPQARQLLSLTDPGPPPVTFRQLAGRHYRCEPQDAWQSWPEPPVGGTTPRYLVRPETQTARELWLLVDTFGMPQTAGQEWLVRLRDVTEQMSLQRDVWKFHSMIVHKLRTPLVGIIGGLQTLVNRAGGLSSSETLRMAGISLEAAQRLHSDIEDVLQYLSTPQLAYPGTGVRLAQVAPIVADLSATLGLAPVMVSVSDELAAARLKLSRRALEMMLLELLDNARKFHPAKYPQVRIAVSHADHLARLQVVDDGVSLSPEQIAHVWTPYYQGEKYLTGQVKGMGLGLPMIASLLYSVGGTAHIYNRDDHPGVVVELLIPLAA